MTSLSRPRSNTTTKTSPLSGRLRSRMMQASFESLKSFVNQISLLETSAVGLLTSLNSIEKAFNQLSDTNIRAVPVYKQAREILTHFNQFTETLKSKVEQAKTQDVNKSLTSEIDNLNNIIINVTNHPPTTSRAQRESKTHSKEILASLSDVSDNISKQNTVQARKLLRKLKSDLIHKYEPFFRLSQLSKSSKTSVSDDCRFSIDRIIALLDFSSTPLTIPDSLDQINIKLIELSKRPENIDTKSRPSSRSSAHRPVSKPKPILQLEEKQKPTRSLSQPTFPEVAAKSHHPSTKRIAAIPSLKGISLKPRRTSMSNKNILPIIQTVNNLPKTPPDEEDNRPKSERSPSIKKLEKTLEKMESSDESENNDKKLTKDKNAISNSQFLLTKECAEAIQELEPKLLRHLSAINSHDILSQFIQQLSLIQQSIQSGNPEIDQLLRLNFLICQLEDEITEAKESEKYDDTIVKAKQMIESMEQELSSNKKLSTESSNIIENVGRRLKRLSYSEISHSGSVHDESDYKANQNSDEIAKLKKELEKERQINKAWQEKSETRKKYINRLSNNIKHAIAAMPAIGFDELRNVLQRQTKIVSVLQELQ